MEINPLLLTDSYKISHWNQRPPGLTGMMSYISPRYNQDGLKELTSFGSQYAMMKYFSKPFTKENIDEAAPILRDHFFGNGLVFNEAGFREMFDTHGGHWPVQIKALPEGLSVPHGNAVATVESTDSRFVWAQGYIEGLLLHQWNPSTVCTYSREVKKIILKALEETGTPDDIYYKFHDFGFRGASSVETAIVGGMAHLVNFKGTDTLAALQAVRQYYGTKEVVGNSIPAMEHGTVIPWGRLGEYMAYENMLDQYPFGPLAIVIDSYDWRDAAGPILGGKLRGKILGRDGFVVFRPDSGVPEEVIPELLEILGGKFGYTTNNKYFKVLDPHVRIIQGDHIRKFEIIKRIYAAMFKARWSADNIAFGCGNGLLQDHNRDEHGYAMKPCSVTVDSKETPVSKNPVGDPLKASKGGRLKLIDTVDGFQTVTEDTIGVNILQPIYTNGVLATGQHFGTIRMRAMIPGQDKMY